MFSSYTSDNFGWVGMGNKAKCEIAGIEMYNWKLILDANCFSKMLNIFLKSILTWFLLENSTMKATKVIGSEKWKMIKGSFIIARGKKMDIFYETDAKLIERDVNVEENDISIELSHKWLGHLSEKEL